MGSVPVFVWNPASRLDPLYDPEDATELPVQLSGQTPAPLVYPRGTILAELAATPGLYVPYNDSLSDGSQVARMILRYRTSVLGTPAAAGALTWVGGEWGPVYSPTSGPAFKSGDFDLSMLIGLDANGLEDLAGRIIQGALGVNEVDSFAQTGGTGTWAFTIPALTIGANSYGALTVSAISATVTGANLALAINNALIAAGVPAYVTQSGGALGTNPIVITWHGALGGVSFVAVPDNTGMSGGNVAITRSTHGVAPFGVVRFG